MKTESRHTQSEKVHPGRNSQKLLSELMDLLKKQLYLAKNGEMGKVVLLSDRVEKLLDELSHLATPVDQTTVQCIRRLYNALCLVLATKKKQLAERLDRIRKGRISHCAYKDVLPKKTGPADIETVAPTSLF
ncbi:hypothetical protein LCGC14_2670610 [marine sediment metagenome]|uniref:Uncharacterized protein n=1 Tax=marine sediment metagenome TaxID=412755 RepID=A0A0F9CG49_9ZZZZ